MLIQFKDITLERDGQPVLAGMNLELTEHRVGIVGPNGAGNSSVLRLMNGLLSPTAGSVWLDGRDLATCIQEVRKKVGFIFQNPDNQFVLPSVREDIDFGLKKRLPDARARALRIESALANVKASHLADRMLHSLSGGEKQLVALATVLATEPEVLLFDEPTTQLDLMSRNRLLRLLGDLNQPCIIASHDLSFMQTMDRVLVIMDGGVAMDGQADEVLEWYRQQCEERN